MKKVILFYFLLIASSNIILAQTPQSFNYQAVVRDDTGVFLKNQSISVRVSLLAESAQGTMVFQETHNVTTDDLGTFSLAIGSGSNLTGSISTISWGTAAHYIQIEIDTNGGNNYIPLATSQILAVPYALYGEDADSDPTNERITSVTLEDATLTINQPDNAQSVDLSSLNSGGMGNSFWKRDEAGVLIFDELSDIEGTDVIVRSSLNNNPYAQFGKYANEDAGYFVAFEDGEVRSEMGVDFSGHGFLNLFTQASNNRNEPNVIIGATPNRDNDGFVLALSDGQQAATLGSIENFTGFSGSISTTTSNQTFNVQISAMDDNYNRGALAIFNESNQSKAGLRFDSFGTSEVFADRAVANVKNFVMDHPEKSNQQIWYACIEGPEAAAYERGTAELVNGEAFIPYSEIFGLVINPTTVTIILTPISPESKGLAIAKKEENGFRVKELAGGTGNYFFDWEAKAVRKGYENYQVVRPKQGRKILQSTIHDNNFPISPAIKN